MLVTMRHAGALWALLSSGLFACVRPVADSGRLESEVVIANPASGGVFFGSLLHDGNRLLRLRRKKTNYDASLQSFVASRY